MPDWENLEGEVPNQQRWHCMDADFKELTHETAQRSKEHCLGNSRIEGGAALRPLRTVSSQQLDRHWPTNENHHTPTILIESLRTVEAMIARSMAIVISRFQHTTPKHTLQPPHPKRYVELPPCLDVPVAKANVVV